MEAKETLPGGKSGSKVFMEMEGGCRWGCTKTVALAKIQRGRIMSFRPDGLAVSLPAAAVIGKAPMALEDKLYKGWQRSLVRTSPPPLPLSQLLWASPNAPPASIPLSPWKSAWSTGGPFRGLSEHCPVQAPAPRPWCLTWTSKALCYFIRLPCRINAVG